MPMLERLLSSNPPVPPPATRSRSWGPVNTRGSRHGQMSSRVYERCRTVALHVPVMLRDVASDRVDLCGTIFFRFALDWTWVDALYHACTTVTAVGTVEYAEFAKHSSAHRAGMLLGTIAYTVVSVLLVGSCVGIAVADVLRRRRGLRSRRLLMALGTAFFVAIVSAGTIGICTIEGWEPLEGVYWSIVTMSTVGTPAAPRHWAGRLFGACFVVVGVGGFAKLISELVISQSHPVALRGRAHTRSRTSTFLGRWRCRSTRTASGWRRACCSSTRHARRTGARHSPAACRAAR